INGDNIRIHFKGHKGYKLKKIIIDGKEIDISTITGDYYEILNVTNKHSIKVIFEKEEKDDNKEIKTGKDNKDNKKIPPGGNENLSYLGILLSVIVLGSSLYYQKKVIINKN
ncbi:MAG: hypothetical protein LBT75_00485, partial [Bacilli bacterium]|nr:hypothetical protein [Bacilli bacterium]